MEEGLAPVVAWLDDLAGSTEGPREMIFTNAYHQRLARLNTPPGPGLEVSKDVTARIATLYAMDFERFGYDIDDIEPETDQEST